jgi:hypothetical protein
LGYDDWMVVEQPRRSLGHNAIEPVAAEQEQDHRWVENALARGKHHCRRDKGAT